MYIFWLFVFLGELTRGVCSFLSPSMTELKQFPSRWIIAGISETDRQTYRHTDVPAVCLPEIL